MGTRRKINAIWWNIKINLQKLVECRYELPTNLQNLMQKDLIEVKIFLKVLGEGYFFKHPACTDAKFLTTSSFSSGIEYCFPICFRVEYRSFARLFPFDLDNAESNRWNSNSIWINCGLSRVGIKRERKDRTAGCDGVSGSDIRWSRNAWLPMQYDVQLQRHHP